VVLRDDAIGLYSVFEPARPAHRDNGLFVPMPDDGWALTAQGIAWLKEDRGLSAR
jgi:hypothetical protein